MNIKKNQNLCGILHYHDNNMIHPHTELKHINNEVGYGVVATKFIPAGTITWVLDKLDQEFCLNRLF